MFRQYVLLICVVFGSLTSFAAEPPKKRDASAFDPKDRATWPKAVTHSKQMRQMLSKALADIALDKDSEPLDRDLAVQLLADLRDPFAISFLIENIALEIAVTVGPSEAKDLFRDQVCFYHLLGGPGKGDWNVGKAILVSLDKEKSEKQMSLLLYVFRAALGDNASLAMVEVELGKRPGPVKKKQLEYLKKHIPQN